MVVVVAEVAGVDGCPVPHAVRPITTAPVATVLHMDDLLD